LIRPLEVVRVPSKSEPQRFAQWLPAAEMRAIIDGLSLSGLKRSKKLQLKTPLDLDNYFLDTTCLKANIHFPTDWVLLRDGVRTLMKATELIRKNGLKSRMRPPGEFLRRMNRLSIEMTQRRRGPDSRRGRKATLRRMKEPVRIVRGKADAEVEFGDTVLVAENAQGIILDYRVWREPAPADVNLLVESMERLKEASGCTVGAVVTDRGFASAANTWSLKSCGIYDPTCPRQPARLKVRMRSQRFVQLQRRRSHKKRSIRLLRRVTKDASAPET
jgi:hypothetical protein